MNAHSKTKDISKAHVPKAYQTGTIDFYGQDFIVTPDVLIPRPETEQLIDEVLSLAGKSILPGVKPTENVLPDNPIIIDVGTGSGCIAITLKRLLPGATVYASDISENAIKIAQKNASRQNIPIHTIISNLLEFINSQAGDDPKGGHQNACGSKILGEEGRQDPPRIDLIVANLPYVDKNWDWIDKDALSAEPSLALYADDGGLDLIKQLIDQSATLKIPRLILEADPCQHRRIIDYAQNKYTLENTRGFILSLKSKKIHQRNEI